MRIKMKITIRNEIRRRRKIKRRRTAVPPLEESFA